LHPTSTENISQLTERESQLTESDGDPLCQDAEGYVWALKECPLVLQEACC
jgi:hypothetical protein